MKTISTLLNKGVAALHKSGLTLVRLLRNEGLPFNEVIASNGKVNIKRLLATKAASTPPINMTIRQGKASSSVVFAGTNPAAFYVPPGIGKSTMSSVNMKIFMKVEESEPRKRPWLGFRSALIMMAAPWVSQIIKRFHVELWNYLRIIEAIQLNSFHRVARLLKEGAPLEPPVPRWVWRGLFFLLPIEAYMEKRPQIKRANSLSLKNEARLLSGKDERKLWKAALPHAVHLSYFHENPKIMALMKNAMTENVQIQKRSWSLGYHPIHFLLARHFGHRWWPWPSFWVDVMKCHGSELSSTTTEGDSGWDFLVANCWGELRINVTLCSAIKQAIIDRAIVLRHAAWIPAYWDCLVPCVDDDVEEAFEILMTSSGSDFLLPHASDQGRALARNLFVSLASAHNVKMLKFFHARCALNQYHPALQKNPFGFLLAAIDWRSFSVAEMAGDLHKNIGRRLRFLQMLESLQFDLHMIDPVIAPGCESATYENQTLMSYWQHGRAGVPGTINKEEYQQVLRFFYDRRIPGVDWRSDRARPIFEEAKKWLSYWSAQHEEEQSLRAEAVNAGASSQTISPQPSYSAPPAVRHQRRV